MNALVAAAVAFALTLALIPLVQFFCRRTRVLDRPGPLKIHTRPIPRLGGFAIMVGIAAGFSAAHSHRFAGEWFCAAAVALIWLAGLIDDVRGLHPGVRLAVQIAGAAFLWQGGLRPHFPLSGPASLAAVALLVVLFVNAFNFWDGADGLCAGAACMAALSYLALPQNALPPVVILLAASTAAACGAFLFFNVPPASIFMGDSGSTTLGFLFALMALVPMHAANPSPRLILFPFVIAAVPLLDALRILSGRVLRRQSPLFGDRSHAYDLLLARGWKPRTVALFFWLMTAACGLGGILLVREKSYVAALVTIAWAAISIAFPSSGAKANTEQQKFPHEPKPSPAPCNTEFS